MLAYRSFPIGRASLEALASAIETTANELTLFQHNLKAYHHAENRLQHSRCPDWAKAGLRAELERLTPIVAKPPIVSLIYSS